MNVGVSTRFEPADAAFMCGSGIPGGVGSASADASPIKKAQPYNSRSTALETVSAGCPCQLNLDVITACNNQG
jgi:hypothetical protein